MSEVVNSWPVIDRVLFGAAVATFFTIPYLIIRASGRLNRIIELLERDRN